MAIAVSLEHLSKIYNSSKALILSKTLDLAIERLLNEGKSPKRNVGEIDNRESHFFLALFWASELARQNDDESLRLLFEKLYKQMKKHQSTILEELRKNQGKAQDIKGYYFPDENIVSLCMRPSNTFNSIIDTF